MQYGINDKLYTFCNTVKDDDTIRESFNELAGKNFGLSFENWYRSGYWTDTYHPYALLYEGRVVANVSVSIMDFLYEREPKRYIQLGTVMTEEAYRHQGLGRFLIEKVLEEWKPRCDGIYLYANDSVLEYYPRFGFRKREEYKYSLPISGGKANAVKLDIEKDADIALLLQAYRRGNPFSRFSMVHGEGLLMFNCTQFEKDNLYNCSEFDAVVIAGFEGNTMVCQDIFGGDGTDMRRILKSVAEEKTEYVRFGFTPKESDSMHVTLRKEENSTFFWHASKDCIFDTNHLMFPLLSHT